MIENCEGIHYADDNDGCTFSVPCVVDGYPDDYDGWCAVWLEQTSLFD